MLDLYLAPCSHLGIPSTMLGDRIAARLLLRISSLVYICCTGCCLALLTTLCLFFRQLRVVWLILAVLKFRLALSVLTVLGV